MAGGDVLLRNARASDFQAGLDALTSAGVHVAQEADGVRISRNGEDLATLLAGDFFGESALLYGAPRNASCATVAPSLLYELQRADLDRVCGLCPAMRQALEQAAADREHDDRGE